MRRVEWWTVRYYTRKGDRKLEYELWDQHDTERSAHAQASQTHPTLGFQPNDLCVAKVTIQTIPTKKPRKKRK